MTSRPRTYRNGRSRGGLLSPGTHVSLTITQFILILGAVVTVAGGYYWMQSNVVATVAKVDTFSTKLDTAIKTNADQFLTQDNKREQLGKDFLAKQDQLNAKVSDLNTSVALQQHDTKTIADTLAKISDQLSSVTIAPSPKGK
jgi:uncharacterized protein HemX